MSEQKYYVKQEGLIYHRDYDGLSDVFEVYLDEDGDFGDIEDRKAFTKQELSELRDGAFYQSIGNLYSEEWKNPLIEFVPVPVESEEE
ncbi:hypothetical protein ACFO26_01715 [Lactococcus nasutitermitis]|uniref:Phage protein n=1 Tax=Lactococcus nasutitermitis TaxID=1652957 RepID=A0ABV9JAW6_9LACT|nr:hypothetical protein [Lactococcus nasutitermitis]